MRALTRLPVFVTSAVVLIHCICVSSFCYEARDMFTEFFWLAGIALACVGWSESSGISAAVVSGSMRKSRRRELCF